ncbi:hypothetical protein Tco_0973782 [Tanacetum coccineum]|uniref:Uncharacterized protein n=1 Tax=Tanacetum coccineum TaxID=301880 RepID=A0ABQ5E9Q1_9ASTR
MDRSSSLAIREEGNANFTLGAQRDLETRLGHVYQLEDDVVRLWIEYYMLELARNDVEESLWPRLIMVQKKEMWPKLPGPEVTKSCWLEKTYMKIRNDIGRLRDCATLVMQRFYLGIFEIFAIAVRNLVPRFSRMLERCQGKIYDIGVPVGSGFPLLFCVLLGLLALAIVAACAFRAEELPLVVSCWMAAKVMAGVSDVDVLLGGILST